MITSKLFEIHVTDDDGSGGLGYQHTEDHCRNVAKYLSKEMPRYTSGKHFYSINRYNNGDLGKAIKY